MTFTPSFSDFAKLARKGNCVAVSASVPADLETPVSAYLKLAYNQEHSFLLESAEQGERIGRYSFIGLHPKEVIRSNAGRVAADRPAPGNKIHRHIFDADLLTYLQTAMQSIRLANPESLPDFCGGMVGYLAYENVRTFEKIKLTRQHGPEIPESLFFWTSEFLVFDHFRKKLSVVILQDVPKSLNSSALKKAYAQAESKIRAYLDKLEKTALPKSKRSTPSPVTVSSNMTQAAFKKKVERVREYIRAGDCIQVVLSQRLKTKAPKDDFSIYRALRSINPSPYMFYFKSGKVHLIGSSPEMLVRKTGRVAEVRPIAGTRPRGKDAREDGQLEENLKKSTKELAEHLMLVDLGRNDLGRVCDFKSVAVKAFARVERYSHVMHLVSDVSGHLKSGKTAFDLLRATFPAGTVSGAPKIRAMQIIDELEPEARGAYAGSLGYFSFNQNMDMCITIRTLVSDGKSLYLQAGAGIVKDSRPEKEFEETLNKAGALLRAIELRESF